MAFETVNPIRSKIIFDNIILEQVNNLNNGNKSDYELNKFNCVYEMNI